MNQTIKLSLLIATGLIVSACSGNFSSDDNAYLKTAPDSSASIQQHSALNVEKQYYGVDAVKPGDNYRAPSVVPPGDKISTKGGTTTTLIGSDYSVLAVQDDLSHVWNDLQRVLAKTPYSIMDQDESVNTYFIIDKIQTGGSIQRSSPIYQLVLSHHNGVTELHLVDTKHQPANYRIANRVMKSIQDNYNKR